MTETTHVANANFAADLEQPAPANTPAASKAKPELHRRGEASQQRKRFSLGETARMATLLVLVAAIVHIVTAFRLSSDNTQSAYARMVAAIPAHKFQRIETAVLRATNDGVLRLPFLGADATHYICHFDAGKAPVRVRAVLPDRAWSAGVFRHDGSLAYFATAMPGQKTIVDLRIVPDAERFQGVTGQALGQVTSGAPPVTVVAPKGFVAIRAPDRGVAYVTQQDEAFALAQCSEPGSALTP